MFRGWTAAGLVSMPDVRALPPSQGLPLTQEVSGPGAERYWPSKETASQGLPLTQLSPNSVLLTSHSTMTSLSELERHSTTPLDGHHHDSVSSNLIRNLS